MLKTSMIAFVVHCMNKIKPLRQFLEIFVKHSISLSYIMVTSFTKPKFWKYLYFSWIILSCGATSMTAEPVLPFSKYIELIIIIFWPSTPAVRDNLGFNSLLIVIFYYFFCISYPNSDTRTNTYIKMHFKPSQTKLLKHSLIKIICNIII